VNVAAAIHSWDEAAKASNGQFQPILSNNQARDRIDGAAHGFYRALMWVGSWWCHQLPGSFASTVGRATALCWRCTGILAGALLCSAGWCGRSACRRSRSSVALALFMPLDVLHALATGGQGNNARRLLTGMLWGIFGTSLFLRFVKCVAARFSPSGTRART
jgi:uncharacterized membrane protein